MIVAPARIETLNSTGKQQMGGWEHINRVPKFTKVAVGGAGVWAVDSNHHIHYRLEHRDLVFIFS
jgi:hypothetical protein